MRIRQRRDARAVEEARLESAYTPKGYRGFESRSLRKPPEHKRQRMTNPVKSRFYGIFYLSAPGSARPIKPRQHRTARAFCSFTKGRNWLSSPTRSRTTLRRGCRYGQAAEEWRLHIIPPPAAGGVHAALDAIIRAIGGSVINWRRPKKRRRCLSQRTRSAR